MIHLHQSEPHSADDSERLQTLALQLQRLGDEREHISESLPERAQSWSQDRVLETERRLKSLKCSCADLLEEAWQMRVDLDVPTYAMAHAIGSEDLVIAVTKLREFELYRTTPGGKSRAVSAALDVLRFVERAEDAIRRLLSTEVR